jgi:ubiquinone/menaquinone biosynthesis C-methylase UbiE
LAEEVLLVLGAEGGLVEEALRRCGPDADVIVVDPEAASLERLERAVLDPRVWFMIGDGEVLPLPDASVDVVLGAEDTPDVERVLR